ncbi:MAG: T9SS type A sorting domain-containing protein, partial [Candidatus Aegiribacteria sp.]|nr:T9SS type A sorting domain-containing protein [Candidatus Aegiribacteria sp.]MBD3295036.1 T9SS type A sorting domain-containing protein [Candidatus Fermentibacteria bacterium]
DPTVAIGEASAGTVTSLYLENPRPNPVTSTSSIEFGLPSTEGAELAVYDLSGRMVRSLTPGELQTGANTVSWNGTGGNGEVLPNGVYCVKLSSPQGNVTRMMLLVR